MPGAAFAKLPKRLTLPSGLVLRLVSGERAEGAPLARAEGAPLFSEVAEALAGGRVTVTARGAPLELGALTLRDFHVVRAALARSGMIDEPELPLACRNCGEEARVRPCAALEVGPYVDGELDDPELDATLPFGEPIDVAPVALGRVRAARTVTFEDRTVARAGPLFAALGAPCFEPTAAVIEAMGLVALGSSRDPARIADALATCDEEAFLAVADAFVASHYPPRLAGVIFCAACGARNDVDAPFERELVGAVPFEGERAGVEGDGAPGFPSLSAFAARARACARGLMHDLPGEAVELVVSAEVPAVDDGGEPLLGSYVPPHPGDHGTPSRPPVISVYYQTFAAMWREDGRYDWEDELDETLEHELEHHLAFLRGSDPMDDEERAAIDEEAARIVGRSEAGRRVLGAFGASLGDFARRTWPLWLLALLALGATLATQR
jgi:hypothetical protein